MLRWHYTLWCTDCRGENPSGCFDGGSQLSAESYDTEDEAEEAGYRAAKVSTNWVWECVSIDAETLKVRKPEPEAEGDTDEVVQLDDEEYADQEHETLGRPLDGCVTARRWSKRYMKALKKQLGGWPYPLYLIRCDWCDGRCVIAESSKHEIDANREKGERWAVMCDDCATHSPDAKVMPPTAGQKREAQKVRMTIDARNRRN